MSEYVPIMVVESGVISFARRVSVSGELVGDSSGNWVGGCVFDCIVDRSGINDEVVMWKADWSIAYVMCFTLSYHCVSPVGSIPAHMLWVAGMAIGWEADLKALSFFTGLERASVQGARLTMECGHVSLYTLLRPVESIMYANVKEPWRSALRCLAA